MVYYPLPANFAAYLQLGEEKRRQIQLFQHYHGHSKIVKSVAFLKNY